MIKNVIKKFFWEHVLMPPKKIRHITEHREKVEKYKEKYPVFRKFFNTALYLEEKEAHVWWRRIGIVLCLCIVGYLCFYWVRWVLIDDLFTGHFFEFVSGTLIQIVINGALLATARSFLVRIHKAFLGAESKAAKEFREFVKSEEEAQKAVKQGSGPKVKNPNSALTESYILNARGLRADRGGSD